MRLPVSWTHHECYRDQHRRLLSEPATISADEFIGMPGYAPQIWMTGAVAAIVHRAADPCLENQRLNLRRQALGFIIRTIWDDENLGSYAGRFSENDLLLEPLSLTLIVDCGEPCDCNLVAILTDKKLLIAEKVEFELGEDFFTDRVILKALLANP